MKKFLKSALEVLVTLVISVTAIGSFIYGMSHFELSRQGKPNYQMTHNCRFVDKVWTGNESARSGRGYHYNYFEFKTIWSCDNGPYYVYENVEITPGELIKGLETGRFKRG